MAVMGISIFNNLFLKCLIFMKYFIVMDHCYKQYFIWSLTFPGKAGGTAAIILIFLVRTQMQRSETAGLQTYSEGRTTTQSKPPFYWLQHAASRSRIECDVDLAFLLLPDFNIWLRDDTYDIVFWLGQND